jgi:uncharacterized membrane protein
MARERTPEAGRVVMVALGTGLAAALVTRRLRTGLPLALLGAGLMYRGLRRGMGLSARHVEVERSVTLERSISDLKAMWRDPQVLSRVLRGTGEIRSEGDGQVEWTLKLPFGGFAGFRAKLVEDGPPEELSWRTEGDPSHDAVRVRFRPALSDWGTVMTLRLDVRPPGGRVGEAVLRTMHRGVDMAVDRILRRLKNLAEAGEIPTLEHNPSGRARKPLLRGEEACARSAGMA